MPSTTLCDYQVLRDSAFVLNAANNNHEKSLHFEIPTDFHMGTGSRRPILAFMMHPREDSHFKIFPNEREIHEFFPDRGNNRGMWEPFKATKAFPEGAGNDCTVLGCRNATAVADVDGGIQ